jgi:hypothetical protein
VGCSIGTAWVKATEVTPSVEPTNAAYTKEWRFNYANIPADGTATIKVRLRELSSAAFKDFASRRCGRSLHHAGAHGELRGAGHPHVRRLAAE